MNIVKSSLMKISLSNGKRFISKSQVQLDLLTPDGENKDLFYRRLREGNKENWTDELAHADRELGARKDAMANLYENVVKSLKLCVCWDLTKSNGKPSNNDKS